MLTVIPESIILLNNSRDRRLRQLRSTLVPLDVAAIIAPGLDRDLDRRIEIDVESAV